MVFQWREALRPKDWEGRGTVGCPHNRQFKTPCPKVSVSSLWRFLPPRCPTRGPNPGLGALVCQRESREQVTTERGPRGGVSP